MTRLYVRSGALLSELQVEYDGADARTDEPEVTAMWAAYTPITVGFVLTPENVANVRAGLNILSNRADERSREASIGPEERKHARKASDALTKLIVRIQEEYPHG